LELIKFDNQELDFYESTIRRVGVPLPLMKTSKINY